MDLEAENDRKLAEAEYNAAKAPGAASALAEADGKDVNESEQKLADLKQKRAQLLVDATDLEGFGPPTIAERFWFGTEIAKAANSLTIRGRWVTSITPLGTPGLVPSRTGSHPPRSARSSERASIR